MSRVSGSQQFIRQVNDAIYGVLDKLRVEDGKFWCECTDIECDERVLMTLREYAVMRQHEDEPVLSRTHAASPTTS